MYSCGLFIVVPTRLHVNGNAEYRTEEFDDRLIYSPDPNPHLLHSELFIRVMSVYTFVPLQKIGIEKPIAEPIDTFDSQYASTASTLKLAFKDATLVS